MRQGRLQSMLSSVREGDEMNEQVMWLSHNSAVEGGAGCSFSRSLAGLDTYTSVQMTIDCHRFLLAIINQPVFFCCWDTYHCRKYQHCSTHHLTWLYKYNTVFLTAITFIAFIRVKAAIKQQVSQLEFIFLLVVCYTKLWQNKPSCFFVYLEFYTS